MGATGWGFTKMPWLHERETVGPWKGADSQAHLGPSDLYVALSKKREIKSWWELLVGALQKCLTSLDDFIVDNFTARVNGDISKLQAFVSIRTVSADQFMVSAFIMNFPGATPLDCRDLDKQPRPPCGTVRVVRTPMGPLPPPPPPPPNPVTQSPQAPAATLLRHEHVVLAAVLQTLDRLQLGAG